MQIRSECAKACACVRVAWPLHDKLWCQLLLGSMPGVGGEECRLFCFKRKNRDLR